MLMLSRRVGERVRIGSGPLWLTVVWYDDDRAALEVEGPAGGRYGVALTRGVPVELDIDVTVESCGVNQWGGLALGFTAPREVAIHREEVAAKIEAVAEFIGKGVGCG